MLRAVKNIYKMKVEVEEKELLWKYWALAKLQPSIIID